MTSKTTMVLKINELKGKLHCRGEMGTNEWIEHIDWVKEEAKELKAEIEKGCGEELGVVKCGEIIEVSQDLLNTDAYYNDFEMVYDNKKFPNIKIPKEHPRYGILVKFLYKLCSKCQNQIEELNKIIGSEE